MQSGDFSPIKTANGDELVIDGTVKVPIRVGGRSTEVDVLVTPDITGLILGVNWMEQQGPVTWNFQYNRIRFREDGKWLALQKERQWLGVRRVFRSQYAVSRDSPTVKRIVRKITRGQQYATSPVSPAFRQIKAVNVMTKTNGNVFGLAGGRLATPPKSRMFSMRICLVREVRHKQVRIYIGVSKGR